MSSPDAAQTPGIDRLVEAIEQSAARVGLTWGTA